MRFDDVVGGDPDETVDEVEPRADASQDPDEFFEKHAHRMIYQTNNYFLPQVRDLIDGGEVLNLRPEYQRRLRWTKPQKSRLIESFLLNIPIPPVFLYESREARYEVMDGQQRLNTVREFLDGEFKLSKLPILEPLSGLTYSECPPRVKRALDRASLSAIILLLESGDSRLESDNISLGDTRRIIFDRLNTGGIKLNPQEMRNALYPGKFNDMIVDITRESLFTTIFGIPPYKDSDPEDRYGNLRRQKNTLYRTMQDCQFVLRYFALKDESNIRGSMQSMLDRAMSVKISEKQKVCWKRQYMERLKFLYDLFDGQPFRLPPEKGERPRLSAAIYDACMVAIDCLWESRDMIDRSKENVIKGMGAAMRNPEKRELLTGQKNTAGSVKERIELVRRIFACREIAQ